MIVVKDIYKRYRTEHGLGEWVLNGVSFTIPPKVSVGLVGRNGAGKSTLLKLIAGTDMPTRGNVERHCMVSWPMGFGGGLQPSLSGRQNAKFVCRLHGRGEDLNARIAGIEEFAELGAYFDEPVKTYSSGMRSRLNFAMSLAFDFDVYISDEVTAAGDAAFKNKAKSAFKKLTDHASIIMVSHGEGTLRDFCTAGIWLNEGKAYWFDDIEDALKAYKNSLPAEDARMLKSPPGKNRQESVKSLSLASPVLKAGLGGKPRTVQAQHVTGLVRQAKNAGLILATPEQIASLGFVLNEGASPILMSREAESKITTEYFDLNNQCSY